MNQSGKQQQKKTKQEEHHKAHGPGIKRPRKLHGKRNSLGGALLSGRWRPKKKWHRRWKPSGEESPSRAVVDSRANMLADRNSWATAAEE
jgi:hypothetical protein